MGKGAWFSNVSRYLEVREAAAASRADLSGREAEDVCMCMCMCICMRIDACAHEVTKE